MTKFSRVYMVLQVNLILKKIFLYEKLSCVGFEGNGGVKRKETRV